jgi:hypothetical protein
VALHGCWVDFTAVAHGRANNPSDADCMTRNAEKTLEVSLSRRNESPGLVRQQLRGGPFKLCLSGVHLEFEMYPAQAKKRLEWATLRTQPVPSHSKKRGASLGSRLSEHQFCRRDVENDPERASRRRMARPCVSSGSWSIPASRTTNPEKTKFGLVALAFPKEQDGLKPSENEPSLFLRSFLMDGSPNQLWLR